MTKLFLDIADKIVKGEHMKSKEQKRDEARIRQDIHSKLSVQEKFVKIGSRRGQSKKEVERLTKKEAN